MSLSTLDLTALLSRFSHCAPHVFCTGGIGLGSPPSPIAQPPPCVYPRIHVIELWPARTNVDLWSTSLLVDWPPGHLPQVEFPTGPQNTEMSHFRIRTRNCLTVSLLVALNSKMLLKSLCNLATVNCFVNWNVKVIHLTLHWLLCIDIKFRDF